MLKRLKLSNTELDRIAEAVTKAESKTTGEIKIVLAPESAHYAFWELLAAVCASAVVFAFLLPFAGKITDTYGLFAWTERTWMLPGLYGFVCFVSIAAAFRLFNIPALDRIVVPKSVRIASVTRRAFRLFVECGVYNNMVSMDESVTSQWAEVQNQYQRRYDLIPNLVSTVKGYASHESDVLTQVAEARSRAGGVVNVDESILTNPEAFARYQQIQSSLSGSLQRLLAVAENYPELKANTNFLALQDQLEGTENRIAVARQRYNEAAQEFNSYIRRVPNNFVASFGRFAAKQYFSADGEAQSAPKVQF